MKSAPNILLLVSDQMRPFELGCYGHPVVKTPNLDRLAAMGVRFEHAITPNPVCTAARSALLSGQYSRTCNGMLGCCGEPGTRRKWLPNAALPEILREQGYETRLTGKWHTDPRPECVGFDKACYPLVAHRNVAQIYFDEERHGEQIDAFGPDYEVRTSQAFITAQHDRPWFLFHNFGLPHMPFFDVPATWRERYDPASLELRPNTFLDGELYHNDFAFKVYLYDHLVTKFGMEHALVLPEGFDVHKLYAEYCGMIACVDDQIGRLLDTLESSGQMDNTIIVFSADHGENLGSHHLWNKVSVNEESLRVPLMIAGPGIGEARMISDQVASLVDIAPTLLGLLGLDVPAHMQGGDLSPQLRGEGGLVRDGAAFAENLVGELAIRTPTHTYAVLTLTSDSGPAREMEDEAFLFTDLRTDPYQMTHLADAGEQADLGAALKERVLAWDRATPWLNGSLGGVYGKGPQHDFPRPRRAYRG